MDERIPRRVSLDAPDKLEGVVPRWTQLALFRSTQARCIEVRIDMSSPGEGTAAQDNQSFPSVYVALSTGSISEQEDPP
jgi:hypothetical protein